MLKKKWASVITNEDKRLHVQYISLFLLLGVVAAFMTVLNVIMHKGALTVVTAVFSVLCFANYGIIRLSKGKEPGTTIVSILFMLELLFVFVFFIVSGNPDGFSVIWVAMLPACGMLVFGRKRTTVFCAVVFALLTFFFWTTPGHAMLQYSYNPTFMERFPILFAAFFSLSFLLETIRVTTQRELDRLREKYWHLSTHDYLTDTLNRQGLEELQKKAKRGTEQAVFILDIDHFKNVNDSFGHDTGDLVLVAVAQEAKKYVDTQICRWGGEEFVVWFPDSREMTDPEEIRKAVEQLVVNAPECNKTIQVTISIGAVKGSGELTALISHADEALYQAKENGRNQVVWAGAII